MRVKDQTSWSYIYRPRGGYQGGLAEQGSGPASRYQLGGCHPTSALTEIGWLAERPSLGGRGVYAEKGGLRLARQRWHQIWGWGGLVSGFGGTEPCAPTLPDSPGRGRAAECSRQ